MGVFESNNARIIFLFYKFSINMPIKSNLGKYEKKIKEKQIKLDKLEVELFNRKKKLEFREKLLDEKVQQYKSIDFGLKNPKHTTSENFHN